MSRRQGFLRSVARILALLTVGAFALPTATTMSQGTINTFQLSSISFPHGITAGPNNEAAVYFTETVGNRIGRITTGGTITNEFTIPTDFSNPHGITAGPDGNLWFTESDGNKIGRMTPAGVFNEFSISTAGCPIVGGSPNCGLLGIAAGPDGNLWFTVSANNKIGKITPAGTITEFAIPTANSIPSRITAGPDSALWFTETGANKIGRIPTTATPGAPGITETPVAAPATGLAGITLGPDGNLWFTAFGSVLVPGSAKVGKITPGGAVTMFTDPNITSPGSIARGSDGALWFAQSFANNIGRITTTGTVSVVALTGGNIFPGEITTGPTADGGLWFTEPFVSRIGKVTPGGGGGPGMLNGSVTLEGLTGANVANRPLVVRLFQPGTETQVGSAFNTTTDASGNFSVSGLPAGTFDIDVKNPQRVSRRASGVIIPASGAVTRAFGLLLAGDVNDGNFVNLSDYNILRSVFLLSEGDPGYDARADMNGSGFVNLSDYNLLRANFLAEGPLPAPAAAGASGAPPR